MELSFDQAGLGRPEFLFLHGMGGDRSHFAPQMDYFLSRGHRVIAPDLAAHGTSPRVDAADLSMSDMGNDVVALARRLEVRETVLVGHSLGAMLGLAIGADSPDWLRAIVMIDPPAFMPEAVTEAFAPFAQALRGPGRRRAIREFYGAFFAPTDDQNRRETILDSIGALPDDVFDVFWSETGGFAADMFARRCRVPLLLIQAAVPVDTEAFRRACPHLEAKRIENAGHYVQLDQADAVNSLITEFVSKLKPSQVAQAS